MSLYYFRTSVVGHAQVLSTPYAVQPCIQSMHQIHVSLYVLKYIHKSKIPCGALIIIIGNSYARFLPNFLNRIICKHDHLHLEKYLDNDDW
jgi:hypothetical protein